MVRINPVPLAELPPSLSAAVARGVESRLLSSTLPVQIWAHRPAVAEAWLAALEAIQTSGCLDARLRELVRLKIASVTNCHACQIARKTDTVSEDDINCRDWSDPHFTPAEQAALHYAQLFADDYFAINDTHYAALESQFSTEQIVELNLFCALMLAGGRMTFVQQAYEAE
ncbi:MAG: carboxymuconolactone decarboxylase family protein [Caulobacter sp.]|nr:carboxymuconolactone decarboxylase family protein [Caulobacter sp.]